MYYCQKTSSEDLCCTLRNCSDVYSAFFSNVEEIRELGCLPSTLVIRELLNFHAQQGFLAQAMSPKSQQFNTSSHAVEAKRVNLQKSNGGTGCTTRPKRIYLSVYQAVCFFCEGDARVMQRQSLFIM